jgi:hypothetical protein
MSEMNARLDRQSVLLALTELEIDYWYEVDHNEGRAADALYVDEGVFAIGEKRMRGREAVAGFYRWRAGRGDRTARHVVTNFRLSAVEQGRASFVCILCLYAADGKPVLASRPAIMIADIVSECELCSDGHWRYRSHSLTPIFEGGEPATIPP